MSEPLDPLEAELSALRPHEVSPGLRRRIADRLADPSPTRRRRPWPLALAGGLAATCLVAAILRWGIGGAVGPGPIVVPPRPAQTAGVDDSWPTLLAYERALARSPEELGALLDKHAGAAPEPRPEPVPICAFTRSDATRHALLGDD